VVAHGRREDGHVAGERLERGQAEALVVGRHEDGVRGVHPVRHLERMNPPERQQLRSGGVGELAGAVGSLGRAGRVGGEEDVAAGRVEAEPLARRGAVDRDEAVEVHAAGQHRDTPARPGAGHLARELGADGGHEVVTGQDGGGDAPRARMAQVRPVQGDDARGVADGERRPRGEPEVGVDDVEALAPVAAPQVSGGARVAARGKGEDLDVDARRLLERGDLVAHEAAARGGRRAGPHARDDEGTHSCVILHRLALSPSHDPPQTRCPYRQSDSRRIEMGYRMMGRGHAALMLFRERLRARPGRARSSTWR
jgi:hypothetical protein